mmetsp:Transcript_38983/g.82371  ORF Transcript_38983/g.82371 Transcript_38983/m.82371 type:complete len:310 (-) Transcript_38983:131-1060(-)
MTASLLSASVAAVIGLFPVVVMMIAGVMQHDLILAMLVFHWIVMFLLPVLHHRAFRPDEKVGQGYIARLVASEEGRFAQTWKWGLLSFVVTTVLGYCGAVVLSCGTFSWWGICISGISDGVNRNGLSQISNTEVAKIVIAGAYFTFVNPVLEEFFWRVWLTRELVPLFPAQSAASMVVAGSDPAVPAYDMGEAKELPYNTMEPSKVQEDFMNPPLTEVGKLVASAMYAAYHFVVVFLILNVSYAGGAFLALTGLGRVLLEIRRYPDYGLWTATCMHSGVDAVIILAIVSARYKVAGMSFLQEVIPRVGL